MLWISPCDDATTHVDDYRYSYFRCFRGVFCSVSCGLVQRLNRKRHNTGTTLVVSGGESVALLDGLLC